MGGAWHDPRLPRGRPFRDRLLVTRLLRARGYRMTLIDNDPAQIALVRRFGVKVFYGDGARPDSLRAAGVAEAKMVVIAVADAEHILSVATLIRRHYPDVIVAAQAVDRSHAHDLMALGVRVFERETFRGAIRLGENALVALGHSPRKRSGLPKPSRNTTRRCLQTPSPFATTVPPISALSGAQRNCWSR